MRRKIPILLASAGLALASPTIFSVHDDILAFPQYEVVFSETFISEHDARLLSSQSPPDPSKKVAAEETESIQSQNEQAPVGRQQDRGIQVGKETYETMWLRGQEYLCSIPIVEPSPRNETSEAEALAEEKKELARATDRGWELLEDLGGEVTQFHQLPPQPGRPTFPPQIDPAFPKFVLGRVKSEMKDNDDEGSNDLEVHKDQKPRGPPATELQIQGDTRYLVQKMDAGTKCDLTGKPRRIEVQFHCNFNVNDMIGWIKEVTTCSYLMVIYTPRLCNDVAFLPPKESKANIIACQQVVPDNEIAFWKELKSLEAEVSMRGGEAKKVQVDIGGVIVGGGKHYGKGGPHLELPPNWQVGPPNSGVDVIASSKGKAEGNKVEVLSDEELQKMDLNPEVVEQLKNEMQQTAGGQPWRLEVVDVPGEVREIRGMVDNDDDETEASEEKEEDDEAGSEETYIEEL